MSIVLTEGRRTGEFLLTEGNGQMSREVVVIAAGFGVIASGTVLGKVSSTGKYVVSPNSAQDGSEIAVAIALSGCDATNYDQKIVAIVRLAEVKADSLLFHPSVDMDIKKANKFKQLADVGISVRT